MDTIIIVIKPYNRVNPVLDDMRTIRIGSTCIVAKNNKFGGLYLHKNAKIVKGKFHHSAGSNSYPILLVKKEVHIELRGFGMSPEITTDQYIKQDIIKLINH